MNAKDFLGSPFLKAEMVKDGDIIKFKNEGYAKELGGRMVATFSVETPNHEEIEYTPNQDTIRNLAEAWGDDMDNWAGKTAIVHLVEYAFDDKKTGEHKSGVKINLMPATDKDNVPNIF